MPEPVVPMATDPLTGQKTPIYAGGDPPIELVTGEPDRGDKPPPDPEAKPAEPAKPAEKGDEAKPDAKDAKPEPSAEDLERDDKGRFITKKRFDEVNVRRKAAEEELAKIKREQAAATKVTEPAYDFDAKENLYIELILDGKTKEAAGLRKEIRGAEQAMYADVATARATESNRAASVEQRINTIVKDYEDKYPQFDPESAEYSEELLDDINALYTGMLQSKRYETAADAFQAAISKTLKAHGIADAAPVATNGATPPRTAARRIDAIKNQPPNISNAGSAGADHGDGNVRIAELSEADFARLPEATRRRLRGDSL